MLLLALLARPDAAHAQQDPGLKPAAKPIPDPCAATFSTSQATICQGGSATLTFSPNQCVAGSYTYAWAPAQDISSTTSPSVVVNPLTTTTYTITVTSSTGAVNSYSSTITVQANCYQTATVPATSIVQLNNDYVYGAAGATNNNDPFSQRPPGTTFHVAGNLTLHGAPGRTPTQNVGEKFTLPAGTVLLMDANASIYVQDGARLETNGATITAACNDMWGGLHIAGTSDQLDMHGVGVGV